MKYKMIGIMGCLTSNSNMGCSALTYTLLQVLEKLFEKQEVEVKYTIFDLEYNEDMVSQMCKELNIERKRIIMTTIGETDTHTLKKKIKCMLNVVSNARMIQLIKKCDVVIDITQGDSFTDIYGLDRFYHLSSIKRIVQKLNIPLVLGPQTYGPFETEESQKYVKSIIEEAALVISRDLKSKKYIESFCDVDVKVATDLAFGLKFKTDDKKSDKIKVGLNVSGLLHSHRTDGSGLNTYLETNYDQYINMIIEYLLKDDRYEIYLIPHVGWDANEAFLGRENLNIHKPFKSPIEAKSFISNMDIFIGARMHATIGAFSAGVATIPVAYSRKFSGLFENIGYNYLIDLINHGTEENYNLTIEYINRYKELEEKVQESSKLIKENYIVIEKELDRVFTELNIL